MKKATALILVGVLCLSGIAARAASDAVIKGMKAQLYPCFASDVCVNTGDFGNTSHKELSAGFRYGTTYLPIRSADKLPLPGNGAKGDKAVADFIGEEKALDIVLEKAGISKSDILYKRVKLDFDDGIYVYEVEIKSGRTETEAEIKADDGTVLSFEKDFDD